MRILVTGSTGLIGSALVPFLIENGHRVIRLTRSRSVLGEGLVRWDPARGEVDEVGLENFDAVVHLAGENISGCWTKAKKASIRDSRVRGTKLLCGALAKLHHPPAVLISASATNYYGDRGGDIVREDSRPGSGFLAGVCREWEAAAEAAVGRGIRVVHLRIGAVLSPRGGALARYVTLFRAGIAGKLGTGEQFISWISMEDLLGIVLHVMRTEALSGPVNAVAPNPVTNLEFVRCLGGLLSRPMIVHVPAFAVRILFGEMADEVLLASTRAEPTRLLSSGYVFRYPDLEGALRHMLFDLDER